MELGCVVLWISIEMLYEMMMLYVLLLLLVTLITDNVMCVEGVEAS